jgi:hypothetical protein
VKSWFDLAGRVIALRVQLEAKTGELRAAHKTIEYWKALANDRWAEVCKLNADVNEARQAVAQGNVRNLLPPPPGVPALGSRDRANAHRLAAENAELRALVDDLKNGRNPS